MKKILKGIALSVLAVLLSGSCTKNLTTGGNETHCSVNLAGFAAGSVTSYVTSAASGTHWQQSAAIAPQANGSFVLTVPANSVITFTGTAN